MSSAHVIPPQSDESTQLSHDEWWALFDELRLAQQPAYAEVGRPHRLPPPRARRRHTRRLMLVYLDTNIWVYAYENDPTFGTASRQFMQNLRSGRHRIASSLFVLNELLVLPHPKR